MAKETSRLTPQHRDWHKDLSLREAPVQGEPSLGGNVLELNEQRLVVSREVNLQRGVWILFAIICLLLFGPLLTMFAEGVYKDFQSTNPYIYADRWYLLMFVIGMLCVLIYYVAVCLRLDLRVPIHNPIRFNRSTGQVQAYEVGYIWWKAFGKWPTVIKQFDWSCVQAEVHRQTEFTGKAYVIRYYFVLCICKPGTLEVVDRLTVFVNEGDSAAIWNYLRTYMAYGPSRLPKTEIKRQSLSFVRSLFTYMPWLEPNKAGLKKWQQQPIMGVFATLVSLCFLPIVILLGLGHYLASRFAPEPDWEHTPVVQVGAGEGAEAAETTP
jgi:hypothetical protein